MGCERPNPHPGPKYATDTAAPARPKGAGGGRAMTRQKHNPSARSPAPSQCHWWCLLTRPAPKPKATHSLVSLTRPTTRHMPAHVAAVLVAKHASPTGVGAPAAGSRRGLPPCAMHSLLPSLPRGRAHSAHHTHQRSPTTDATRAAAPSSHTPRRAPGLLFLALSPLLVAAAAFRAAAGCWSPASP